MDNILVFTSTLEEHRRVIQEVLMALRNRRLFLKPEKCKFEQQKINYLRLVILENHITMDPVKVQGVTNWPAPTKVKEVQSFLGFINFYRCFIRDFLEKA